MEQRTCFNPNMEEKSLQAVLKKNAQALKSRAGLAEIPIANKGGIGSGSFGGLFVAPVQRSRGVLHKWIDSAPRMEYRSLMRTTAQQGDEE